MPISEKAYCKKLVEVIILAYGIDPGGLFIMVIQSVDYSDRRKYGNDGEVYLRPK